MKVKQDHRGSFTLPDIGEQMSSKNHNAQRMNTRATPSLVTLQAVPDAPPTARADLARHLRARRVALAHLPIEAVEAMGVVSPAGAALFAASCAYARGEIAPEAWYAARDAYGREVARSVVATMKRPTAAEERKPDPAGDAWAADLVSPPGTVVYRCPECPEGSRDLVTTEAKVASGGTPRCYCGHAHGVRMLAVTL